MTRRLRETLRGIGPIHAGDVLLRNARYELAVWSEDRPASSGGESKAVENIDGHIDITGIGEAAVLGGTGTLILTIEDGRRLAFQLTSSGGGIVAQGWLPE